MPNKQFPIVAAWVASACGAVGMLFFWRQSASRDGRPLPQSQAIGHPGPCRAFHALVGQDVPRALSVQGRVLRGGLSGLSPPLQREVTVLSAPSPAGTGDPPRLPPRLASYPLNLTSGGAMDGARGAPRRWEHFWKDMMVCVPVGALHMAWHGAMAEGGGAAKARERRFEERDRRKTAERLTNRLVPKSPHELLLLLHGSSARVLVRLSKPSDGSLIPYCTRLKQVLLQGTPDPASNPPFARPRIGYRAKIRCLGAMPPLDWHLPVFSSPPRRRIVPEPSWDTVPSGTRGAASSTAQSEGPSPRRGPRRTCGAPRELLS